MRAPRKPFQPAQPVRARGAPVAGVAALVIAMALGVGVIVTGALRGPRSLDPARAEFSHNPVVNLGPEDRVRLDDWSEFFACHGLVGSNNLMLATMRANGGTFAPDRPIRMELAPSADLPPPTAAEQVVIDRAAALANAEPGQRDAACSAHAAPSPPAASAGEPAEPAVDEEPPQ